MHELIQKYTFPGYHAHDSHCKLEIVGDEERLVLITMTERKDNPGTSITNRSEIIASLICAEQGYDLVPGRCIFVEHYDENSYNVTTYFPEHRYSIVTYQWRGARAASGMRRTSITPEQYQALQAMVDHEDSHPKENECPF